MGDPVIEDLIICITESLRGCSNCTHTHRDRVGIPVRAASILWEDFDGSQPGNVFSVFNSLGLTTVSCH